MSRASSACSRSFSHIAMGTRTACARRCEPKNTGSMSPSSKRLVIWLSAARTSLVVTTGVAIVIVYRKSYKFLYSTSHHGSPVGACEKHQLGPVNTCCRLLRVAATSRQCSDQRESGCRSAQMILIDDLVRCGDNYPYIFKGAYGASQDGLGPLWCAGWWHPGAPDRRGIPPPPAGVAGTPRSPGGSVAAPFRAGALRARRLPHAAGPHPAVTGAPAIGRWPHLQERTGRPPRAGDPVTEQRSPSRGAPAARRCALAQAPPLEQ